LLPHKTLLGDNLLFTKRAHLHYEVFTGLRWWAQITLWLFMVVILHGCQLNSTGRKPASKNWITPKVTAIPEQSSALSFEMLGNIPFVQIYVNDRGPFLFVLDTGTTGLVISPQLRNDLDIPYSGRGINIQSPGGVVSGPMGFVRSIRIGQAEFQHIHCCVTDISAISKLYGREISGVLGLAVFAQCRLTIDYPACKIVLERDKGTQPLFEEDPSVLHLRPVGTKLVSLPLKINDKILWLMLDSGQDHGLMIPEKASESLPLAYPPVRIPTASRTYGGIVSQKQARLKTSVFLGENEFVDPMVTILPSSSLIGGKFLRHFVITIDQKNMLIRFTREMNTPIPPPPSFRHHGFFFTRQDKEWLITGAIPDSSLECIGLKNGDCIETINSQPVSDITDSELSDIVYNKDLLTLEIIREDAQVSVDVPVSILVP